MKFLLAVSYSNTLMIYPVLSWCDNISIMAQNVITTALSSMNESILLRSGLRVAGPEILCEAVPAIIHTIGYPTAYFGYHVFFLHCSMRDAVHRSKYQISDAALLRFQISTRTPGIGVARVCMDRSITFLLCEYHFHPSFYLLP